MSKELLQLSKRLLAEHGLNGRLRVGRWIITGDTHVHKIQNNGLEGSPILSTEIVDPSDCEKALAYFQGVVIL